MLDVKVTRKQKIELEKTILKVNREFLHEASMIILGEAKARAPYYDGELRKKIVSRVEPERAIIAATAPHSIYLEYGTGIHAEGGDGRKTPWVYFNQKLGEFFRTVGIRAQPYMRPAADKHRKKLTRMYRDLLRKEGK